MPKRDLILLLADLDAENTIRSLLDKRTESLGIRPISFDIVRHSMRDSGCCREAGAFLRGFTRTHQHAAVVFDHHGSGRDAQEPEDVENSIENDLRSNGWQTENCSCIVLKPELEIWAWTRSVHLANLLGFDGSMEVLNKYLIENGHKQEGFAKPSDPKTAFESCLRRGKIQRSARLFGKLAEKTSLKTCEDRSFSKFKLILKKWFPQTDD
jgi:hypothetical protein